MRTLLLGFSVEGVPNAEGGKFRENVSILDYDAVFLDVNAYIGDYELDRATPKYQGQRLLSSHESVRLQSDVARRRREIKEMLRLGRVVVVHTPQPASCYVDTGDTETSGTGQNARITNIVAEFDLLSCLPIKLRTETAVGRQLTFVGKEPFTNFARQNRGHLSYGAFMVEPVGDPLFVISNTDRVVGSVVRLGEGLLVLLPRPDVSDSAEQADGDEGAEDPKDKFMVSVLDLIKALNESEGGFSLPEWAKAYRVPNEDEVAKEIIQLESELRDTQLRIDEAKERAGGLERKKVLFTGSGRVLETEVMKVLESFGFDVRMPDGNRTDLKISLGDRTAVVEVKGVGKSAAESHAAQLEKWVAEHLEETGEKAKGILVVNAFSAEPIDDRTDAPFPDQMISYSVARDHCLITGLQLLGLHLRVLDGSLEAADAADRLMSTTGIFEDESWKEFLSTPEPKTSPGRPKEDSSDSP